jgi:hypothetical protein
MGLTSIDEVLYTMTSSIGKMISIKGHKFSRLVEIYPYLEDIFYIVSSNDFRWYVVFQLSK